MERLVTPIIPGADLRHECMGCGRSYANSSEVAACWQWHEDGNPEPIPGATYAPQGVSWRKTASQAGWSPDSNALYEQAAKRASSDPVTPVLRRLLDAGVFSSYPKMTFPAPPTLTDHAAACLELLRKQVTRLENGDAPEDIGPEIVLIGRMMARKT